MTLTITGHLVSLSSCHRITSIFRGGVRRTDPIQAEFLRCARSVRWTFPRFIEQIPVILSKKAFHESIN